MTRNKPYYSKKQIRNFIFSGNVSVTDDAKESAEDDFGWDKEAIYKAMVALPIKCCYKSETRFQNPKIWVDYYRAPNINGENIYTHFYVDEDKLIIDSFKELYK
jgi:hypothetical protein